MLWKLFYRVYIIAKGDDHVMNPFNNFLELSLTSDFYLVDMISLCLNFQRGLFRWWALILLHAFITIHVWLFLISVLCLTCWALPRMLRWLKFRILQAFLTCGDDFYLFCVWCVTVWTLSTNVLHTLIRCMHPLVQKRCIYAPVCSY